MSDRPSHDTSPHADASAPGKAPREEVPLWARRGLLEWYMDLGLKGKLAWLGVFLLAVNGVAWLCGFIMPKMIIAGVIALVVSAVIPNCADD
jgi:hypothetical protein